MTTKAERTKEAVRQRTEARLAKKCECGHKKDTHLGGEEVCMGRPIPAARWDMPGDCPCTAYKEAKS